MKVNLIRMKPIDAHTNLAVRLINQNLQYFYNDVEITPEMHLKFLSSLPSDDHLWVVEKDDQPCGLVGVYHIDKRHNRCEWGRLAVDQTVRAVGSLVEFMILDFVFHELKMHKLYCEVLDENVLVIQLHEKFRFKVEGKYRDHIFKDGKYKNVTCLSILDADWEIARPRFAKMFEDKAGNVEH